jgi:hypothetical protein
VNGGATGAVEPPCAAGPPSVRGRPGRNRAAVVACLALQAALLASAVAVPAALWSRLPGRVADHWTLSGTADGTMPRLLAFGLLGGIAVVGTGVAWGGLAAGRRRAPAGPPAMMMAMMAIGLLLTAAGAASVILVAVANLGNGPGSASVGPGAQLGLAGGPVLLAAGAAYLLRRHGGVGAADDGASRASLGLRAGERAVWTGRARASWAWPAGVLLAAAGISVAVATAAWVLGAVLTLVGLLTLCFTSVRVTVAARGLTVGYGVLGLRLTRIPLRRIASSAVVQRTAFSFGYRGSLLVFGSAAVALRRGPALRLTLLDGKTFLVTVDDAATGAALLNDLVAAAG